MEYYLKEELHGGILEKTAFVKPKADVEKIMLMQGIKGLPVESSEEKRHNVTLFMKLFYHFATAKYLNRACDNLSSGDVLYIQYPLMGHSVFNYRVFRKLKKKGVHLVFILHDLPILRVNRESPAGKRIRAHLESAGVLESGACIIAHNTKMAKMLEDSGLGREKIVTLGIFDYLLQDEEVKAKLEVKHRKDLPVVIAGNLDSKKAGYLDDLPDKCSFYLYGVNYRSSDNENVEYKGSFSPDELPYAMEGSFGLVWDGTSAKTCEGVFGEYLRINNPHKTSLYLASGIPVIIWKEAALADFIAKKRCGLIVASLEEIEGLLKSLDEEDYKCIRDNAIAEGRLIREGHYMKTAIEKSRKLIRHNLSRGVAGS